MKHISQKKSSKQSAAALGAAVLSLLVSAGSHAAPAPRIAVAATPVTAQTWGLVTAPTFGTTDPIYSGAELTAGPSKFGSYFQGVIPNGKFVRPAGVSVQIGLNPLGSVLTPDGKYLITSNDDEREGGGAVSTSTHPPDNGSTVVNRGSYTLSVIDTASMKVVSQVNGVSSFFIGLQAAGSGPYKVYASGGPNNSVQVFTIDSAGTIGTTPTAIPIAPILPKDQGYVSNYTPASTVQPNAAPSGYSRFGAATTFPAGSALSPDGRFLYVACNGDNSLAVIRTSDNAVVNRIPVGFFPYGVSVSRDGSRVLVSNWGVSEYKFLPTEKANAGSLNETGGVLTSLARISPSSDPTDLDPLFFVPSTSAAGGNPQTSSISVISAPRGDGSRATLLGSVYQGQPGGLDDLNVIGETHPSATAIVRRGALEVLYVTKSNSDSLGLMLVANNRKLADFDLSPLNLTLNDGHKVHGSYPNALAVSSDNTRLYIAEAGLNSVAVLDVSNPTQPKLLGRIPTGWYPTALSLSPDGKTLFVTNAKGVGEDINPATGNIVSFSGVDSNYLFGSAQKISLANISFDNSTVAGYNYAVQPSADTSIVPVGGAASTKIKHVFFIEHENKSFDSVLGSQSGHFGPFASSTFNAKDGTPFTNGQFNGVALNTQLLANTFAAGVNYYSDAEESDAGHQFCASGISSDYTQKTLLVKSGRGLLVNKNFEPEDYPEGGYIFNNAARNGVSFKNYGELIRIDGTDTGTSTGPDPSAAPGTTTPIINDPLSGLVGAPQLNDDQFSTKLDNSGKVVNAGDVTSPTQGLGQSYFLNLPILSILGSDNPNGEPRLDRNYPGYNFNISDQRRALEFCKDFDRMEAEGTLPQFLYIYQPNDHTGGVQASNSNIFTNRPAQQVGDGDVALGMVVEHIMRSKSYYDSTHETGGAIFITYDDAQSSLDHIHPHRTPLIVVSPFAKTGYIAKKHYVTASIVKTEELLLGLPPNNYGDLFATDLRDLFTSTYNGITADDLSAKFTRECKYEGSAEGDRIWKLTAKLDTSAPDRDSLRLGALARLSMAADSLHHAAVQKKHLKAAQYQATQIRLYQTALKLTEAPAPKDNDD